MGTLRAKRRWTTEARGFFRDITAQFEIDEKHHAIFYGTCENLDRFYRCNEILQTDGLTFKTESGQVRKHPACQISKDSWSGFLQGMKSLGLHEYQSKLGRPPGR